MAPVIKKGIYQLVEEANQVVREISVVEAVSLYDNDAVQFIDLRDIRELEREGVIPGAYHCPRGMLEFWVDPESPYAKTIFQQDLTFVLFCGGGLRSALAGKAVIEMGLIDVVHIQGGYAGWKKEGGVTVKLPTQAPK